MSRASPWLLLSLELVVFSVRLFLVPLLKVEIPLPAEVDMLLEAIAVVKVGEMLDHRLFGREIGIDHISTTAR